MNEDHLSKKEVIHLNMGWIVLLLTLEVNLILLAIYLWRLVF